MPRLKELAANVHRHTVAAVDDADADVLAVHVDVNPHLEPADVEETAAGLVKVIGALC